jgi:rSAM/selenodomain-associated transferase 1
MRRLALLARWPAPGEVKTRLSPALPAALACDLYRAMLEDAIAAIAGAEAEQRFVYGSGAPAPREGLPVPPGFRVREQAGRDLGERIEHAFADLIVAPDDRAAVIGADCPALDAAMLDDALAALASHDVVLGPARDGGYYVIGLGRQAPELFRGIEWSTARVLDQTLGRAAQAGLTVALLPPLDDLDTPEDLVRWIAIRARGGPPAPGALDRALRAIGLLPPS